jgi:hypothetical protein
MLIPGLKAGVIEEKSVNPRDRRPGYRREEVYRLLPYLSLENV